MQHITMFKYDRELNDIRCVIAVELKKKFEALGFVDHIDKVKPPVKRTRKKADA